ncbi:MAG: glycosyltransferase family 4 protein [Chloroflexi bacterium]|nr:glycosyltransferase family 4 protein [Chloroflexota bacterium]
MTLANKPTDTLTRSQGGSGAVRAPLRLRIAQVTATFPPYFAGTGNVCYYSALELARRGHDVTVFTVNYPPGDFDYPPELKVRRLPALFRIGNAPFLPGLAIELHDFDVIHLHSPFIFGAEMVWAAAKARGIPYVVTHHNDLIGDGLRRYLFDAYSAVSSRLVFGGARKLAVVSFDHARGCRMTPLFQRRWSDVVEAPNGVNADEFRPGLDGGAIRRQLGIPEQAKVAMFVGALDRAHHFKGAPHLLNALPLVRDRDAMLLLVGDGDLRPELEQQAAALGLTDRVRFAGAVQHDALPPYFAAADLVVLPSFPPESFGIVLIEAMASGLPALAHNIPGVRSVITDGVDGLLAEPGNTADLAAKLDLLLGDAGLRTRMGEAGRRKVQERYDWRSIAARLETIYLDMIGRA